MVYNEDDFLPIIDLDPSTYCTNCHGVQDLNIVFRRFYSDKPDWCPYCCSAKHEADASLSTSVG